MQTRVPLEKGAKAPGTFNGWDHLSGTKSSGWSQKRGLRCMPYKKMVICTPFGIITSGRDGRVKSLSVSRVKLLAGGYKRKHSLIYKNNPNQPLGSENKQPVSYMPYTMLNIIQLPSLIIFQWTGYRFYFLDQALFALLIGCKLVCHPLIAKSAKGI